MGGEFSLFWSVILPAGMFIISFVVTYLLYRHFVGQLEEHEKQIAEDKKTS